LIGDLLDLSKIEAGKLDLHETVEPLDKIIDESLRVVMSEAGSRGVTLMEKKSRSGITVCADKTALKQMLINLLSNSLKFTRRGGLVTVSSSLSTDGSLTLEVSDTGIGMTAEDLRKALEPYFQLEPGLSAHTNGTGLGLPLTMKLAELHGGTLTIKSTPGCGTSAIITLPASRVYAASSSVKLQRSSPQPLSNSSP